MATGRARTGFLRRRIGCGDKVPKLRAIASTPAGGGQSLLVEIVLNIN
jgi:hypothetical protein